MKRDTMVSKLVLVAVMASGLALAQAPAARPANPNIPFGPKGMDFAEVDYQMPLTAAMRAALTPDSLEDKELFGTQEKFDQLYARLSAGPIPDGAYYGKILIAPDSSLGQLKHIMEGLGYPTVPLEKLKEIGEALWKGKHFYKEAGVLRNLMSVTNHALLSRIVVVPFEQHVPKVLPNPADIIRELNITEVDGKRYWELFPAKLHCGQSLLDSRRESVIIDYAFTDELPRYHRIPDALAGRNGLRIRDEIRMVRPGFYLGRAYMDGAFALNFALYNERAATAVGPVNEECFTGTQLPKPVVNAANP